MITEHGEFNRAMLIHPFVLLGLIAFMKWERKRAIDNFPEAFLS